MIYDELKQSVFLLEEWEDASSSWFTHGVIADGHLGFEWYKKFPEYRRVRELELNKIPETNRDRNECT